MMVSIANWMENDSQSFGFEERLSYPCVREF